MVEYYFDCWDDVVCCGIIENGRCCVGGERVDGYWWWLWVIYDVGVFVCFVGGYWVIYF